MNSNSIVAMTLSIILFWMILFTIESSKNEIVLHMDSLECGGSVNGP